MGFDLLKDVFTVLLNIDIFFIKYVYLVILLMGNVIFNIYYVQIVNGPVERK